MAKHGFIVRPVINLISSAAFISSGSNMARQAPRPLFDRYHTIFLRNISFNHPDDVLRYLRVEQVYIGNAHFFRHYPCKILLHDELHLHEDGAQFPAPVALVRQGSLELEIVNKPRIYQHITQFLDLAHPLLRLTPNFMPSMIVIYAPQTQKVNQFKSRNISLQASIDVRFSGVYVYLICY